jgi:septal ring factor EnvC (AmiA/AmiB activator)
VYKDWSLQARTGIVDTEWTLKKTELLKLDAEEVLKRLDNNENCLLQTKLRRKSTYKKIENLHKNLKSSSTDHHNIEEQIAIEEDVLDKIFTELKSSQSSLEMAITRSSVCQADATDIVTDSDKSVNLKTVAVSPGLTEDEIMHVVTSTMDDFRVEYGE